MKALLLSAGFGTRLRPITDHTPKCLVTIQGKPLLARWFDLLFRHSVNEVLINTHYLPDVVRDFVAQSPWKENIALVHEPELLGTAGTILKNREFFANEPFILAHADNLTRFNVDEFIWAHQHRKPDVAITMMTFETDTPESCGIVELDQENIVIQFHEKSKEYHGNRANAAVYIVEPSVIDFLSSLSKEVIDFSTEVLPHYIGRIQVYHNDDYHRDIGTPQSLKQAELEF
jgi:mannose-1-phosphate guanylyltransferase